MSLSGLRIAFHTLGCKVNIYETEVMTRDVLEAGAAVVDFSCPADVCVINTCSVTNMADRKSRQMLHRAKALNPDALIVAAGCYAESADETALRETGADLILGNELKKTLVPVLEAYFDEQKTPENPAIGSVKEYTKESLSALSGHTRADVKVQDGCNQFCSYCMIPYVRGRVRSKALKDAVEEIRVLSETGIREVVLSGIHLSSYGIDFHDGTTLLDLIKAVHALPKITRIRLGSLEPRIITEEFAKTLSELPKICPHFHLSLQSGSATVLKRMNRHYTPEAYLESCAYLRKYFDDPAITTDVIVGFPQETDEEFEESLAFVKVVGFYELHVFQYSRRKGTRADVMTGQVSPEVKKIRSGRMIEAGEEMTAAYRARHVGKTVEVLTEELSEDKTSASGYTKEYVRVNVSGGEPNREYTGVLVQNEDGSFSLA